MKNSKIGFGIFLLILATAFSLEELIAQSTVVGTKHNLSVSGPGTIKAAQETEVCIFCHTPHSAQPNSPLWNHTLSGVTYTLYGSPTLQAQPGQPDGSSQLCLSCHDGTIALGSLLNPAGQVPFIGGITTMPIGKSNLSSNLGNDHPISFVYNSSLAIADGQLKQPLAITPPVKLENGKVQCTSCHDPHKNLTTDFLVTPVEYSALCISCHQISPWSASSHNTSTKTWNGTLPNPWPSSPPSYTTVAQNGCSSCHLGHNSGSNLLLMKYTQEENNCYDCHNGNASLYNVYADFQKTYRHNVSNYLGIHQINEPVQITSSMHVECADCHNPHAASELTAVAPNASGSLAGVRGITQSGLAVNQVSYEYEVCYRCHAGSPGSPPPAIPRVMVQNNVMMEFSPANPSYHPVAAVGKNPAVPSLIAPLTVTSRIYCSSCHAGNTGGTAGPHGSIYPNILKLQNLTQDGGTTATGTTESPSAYALCYSCHSRTSILSDLSFKEHSKHLQSGVRAPCSTCHDPHGISSTQGNSANNTNLINFRSGVVTNSSSGQLKFVDLAGNHGQCYLTCHGKNHNPLSY